MCFTYIADTCCPLRQVIEGSPDVKKSHMESMQKGQSLLQDKHGWQTCLPLGLRQEPHCLACQSPQPRLQAPQAGCCLPPTAAALLPPLQLIFQAHQDLVKEVRKENLAGDKKASSGSRGDCTFSGIHLNDVGIFFTQCLITWAEKCRIIRKIRKNLECEDRLCADLGSPYLKWLLNHSMQGLTAALSLSSNPAIFWNLHTEGHKHRRCHLFKFPCQHNIKPTECLIVTYKTTDRMII